MSEKQNSRRLLESITGSRPLAPVYRPAPNETEQISKNTNEQLSKEAEQQISREAEQQISKEAEQQISREAEQQMSKLANEQISKLAEKQNEEKPEKVRRITFNIPESLFKQLKMISIRDNITLLDIGAAMAREYIKNRKEESNL